LEEGLKRPGIAEPRHDVFSFRLGTNPRFLLDPIGSGTADRAVAARDVGPPDARRLARGRGQ